MFQRDTGMNKTRLTQTGILIFILACAAATFAASRAYAQVISDTAPPQLVTFSFSPTAIDVTAGSQTVTVTARVTDNLSGTSSVFMSFRSPSGAQVVPLNSALMARTSG